jgi:hypothetical protein
LESFIDDATNKNGARRLSIDLVDQWWESSIKI